MTRIMTSESVTEGHPDKVADQISDAILDNVLYADSKGRVACETFVTGGKVIVGGEITTNHKLDSDGISSIIRHTLNKIGYNHADMEFNAKDCEIISYIQPQSPDIAMGVDDGGAGDQGMMFGYASDETAEFMPAPIVFAHRLCEQLAKVRKDGTLSYLRPDGKSQVSVKYENSIPVGIDAVVIAAHHARGVSTDQIRSDVMDVVIKPILPEIMLTENTKYFINATGLFEVGGPEADTGLTGRKIIVDSYGGMALAGGGCFSGKDPSKVDRSGAYMARYIAKNIVASGVAKRCEIQVAYAIGVAKPVSLYVDTFGTSKVNEDKISKYILGKFDLSPRNIIEHLDLLRPIYEKTASYGHFGRSGAGFTWEDTSVSEEIKKELR